MHTQELQRVIQQDADTLSKDFIKTLEYIERDVWHEFHSMASVEESNRYGIYTNNSLSAFGLADSRVLMFNRAVATGLDRPITEDQLDDLLWWYGTCGVQRFFFQLNPIILPTSIREWLTQRHFRHYNDWAKLYRLPSPVPEIKTRFSIEPASVCQSGLFAQIVAEALSWPTITESMISRLFECGGWHFFFACEEGTPVAASAMCIKDGIAYFGPSATRPAYRKQGAQSALIAHRIHSAQKLGCSLLVAETSRHTPEHASPSYLNLTRQGFQLAYHRPNYLYEKDFLPTREGVL